MLLEALLEALVVAKACGEAHDAGAMDARAREHRKRGWAKARYEGIESRIACVPAALKTAA
ncbi:MAG: hypothetical protein NVS3B20_11020 [Polyangiales bacterium]